MRQDRALGALLGSIQCPHAATTPHLPPPPTCHHPLPASAPYLPAGPYEFITFKETQGGCWPMHPLVVWRIVLVLGQVFFNGTRLLMGRRVRRGA